MPVDLDELERLEREATPGPWELWEKHLYIFAGPAEENDPSCLKGARVTICDADFDDGEWEYQEAAERGHAVGTPEGDFNLIVAARNALPDLIAELRTLRARVSEADELRARAEASVASMSAEMTAARELIGGQWWLLECPFCGSRSVMDGLRRAFEARERELDACRVDHAEAYEQGRRDALREAIDLCQRTEAGDTNHYWREAAKCCRELIESLADQAAEEAAR